MNYPSVIAEQLGIGTRQVEKTIELLEQGATVPFIARYRKEATGSLNEVQITAIRDLLLKLKELDKRRESILASIRDQGRLTPELEQQLLSAATLTELEDLYLPFKPKRRTRASIAAERGLEPLANELQRQYECDLRQLAAPFVNAEKGVASIDDALAGARDILAERVSENQQARNRVRNIFRRSAFLSSKVVKAKEDEAHKYESWFDWTENAMRAPSHRILALFRGEEEGLLRVHVQPQEDQPAIEALERQFVSGRSDSAQQMCLAVRDGYKRLLAPSIETEFYNLLKEKADKEAIRVFAENLRQLLLASPLGQKRILAIDPGFRTGCKTVCLDAQGQLLHNETIYPFTSVREERAAVAKLEALVEAFHIEAIAIGNGTAGRETEEVVKRCRFPHKLIAVMVSENGASVYSASEIARREFPDYDVTVRGAVSIGRRLMDPLSELVKIDPKSIGVGQYQHDVNQSLLQESLHDVVVSCVNSVGVELNTASRELLSYVSGIGPALADKIVDYRNRQGAFACRADLKKVERLGEKAFEQCAGFLRVRKSDNPLDRSAVHPERYALVERMAQDLGATVQQLMDDKSLRDRIEVKRYVTPDCGLPTLQDIMTELEKPGLDPRARFEVFEFDKNVTRIEDLQEGMVLPGIVTNITAFGAFIDVGVHQDGLVHISQLADRRVSDPSEVVRLHQHVKVKVIEVDLRRHRISLTMKGVTSDQ
uniref:Putative tex-like protein n=1 Tax=uncultured bacterium fosmid pJB17E7_contig I TaxID=1478055 RepID=A0A0H3U7H5_9BACT|nr:putative tex-like protein [uncultured bacterium fosmid pJB17E7_contig I]